MPNPKKKSDKLGEKGREKRCTSEEVALLDTKLAYVLQAVPVPS
jgi:hypothetical protein